MQSFFFNDTATTEIYTLSLHDALPIYPQERMRLSHQAMLGAKEQHGALPADLLGDVTQFAAPALAGQVARLARSEEHTSELQSRQYLVCRLLLEKKKYYNRIQRPYKHF